MLLGVADYTTKQQGFNFQQGSLLNLNGQNVN
jgi:hypothetical protein